MKSERGVTLTSIMIYVFALTIVVMIIARISTYFYSNVNELSNNSAADAEYTKFNSYFTAEINTEGNEVQYDRTNNQYIIFTKTENQYTYQNGSIYMNKAKICKNIDKCIFNYDETTEVITVQLTINGKNFDMAYTIAK